MKLIIQIPCYNEAEMLAETVAALPTALPGIRCIEVLVVDDGSEDETAVVARTAGVHHLVQHKRNLGLARAFQTGLDACLQRGADIIVNTDADNQYRSDYIAQLVAPICTGTADLVIGDRQIDKILHFSPIKKQLQKFGSWMVRSVSGTDVPDAPSGFRAYSREAALRLNILSRFSYTLETIIQAGKQGLVILSIPVETNAPTRPSRLQRNMWHFIKSQASTIVRLYAFYEPLRTFGYLSLPFLLVGGIAWLRFFIFALAGQSDIGRFIQSITIGTGLLVVGVIIFAFGIQADIANKHRQLTQETLYRLKKLEFSQSATDTQMMPKTAVRNGIQESNNG